jgi:hypothetical protein
LNPNDPDWLGPAPRPSDFLGTLTVTNTVTLSGTTAMKINKGATATNDSLHAASIALGGDLTVTNIGVPLLRSADNPDPPPRVLHHPGALKGALNRV